MAEIIETGVEKQAALDELNPRNKKSEMPPYSIQGGLRAAAIGADFLDLTARQLGPQTIQSVISLSGGDGTLTITTSSANDILLNQVFGV
jgi:hypothetical protein